MAPAGWVAPHRAGTARPAVARRRRGGLARPLAARPSAARGWVGVPWPAPRGAIEAELLAKMVQGHRGHAYAPGAVDEVEDVVAGGVAMGQHEFGDRAGIAWQQLAVGPAGHAVVGCLDDLLGRDALLMGAGRPAEADQAGDLRDLESGVAVQQKMAEQPAGIIIAAAALPKGKGALQQAALRGGAALSAICTWESHCAKAPSVATMRNPPW